MVGFIVAITLTFSRSFHLDPLTPEGIGPESEVRTRLGEEKLVPPPDLPPSFFISTERPNLETADRDWKHMDSVFTQVVLKLFAKMEQRGYPVALLEGYRSPERQEILAEKGPSVTNARAFQSKHQYGMAADIAPMRNGKLVISERDPWAASAYQALGEEAQNLGLVWGGRWAMRDLGHVESAAKISTLAKASTPSF
jgi:peptidoglycan L-alanyl-D-glutamate endopeptidase CwlK